MENNSSKLLISANLSDLSPRKLIWDIFGETIFNYKMVGGMIYRSVLAMELKKLGYRFEKTRKDGRFEVAGISRSDI